MKPLSQLVQFHVCMFVYVCLFSIYSVLAQWRDRDICNFIIYLINCLVYRKGRIPWKQKLWSWFKFGRMHFEMNHHTRLSRKHLMQWKQKVQYLLFVSIYYLILWTINVLHFDQNCIFKKSLSRERSFGRRIACTSKSFIWV